MRAARREALARKALDRMDRGTRATLVAALRRREESLGALATRLNQPMETLLALAEVEKIPLGRVGTRAKWGWNGRVQRQPVEPPGGLAKLIVREADVGPIRDPFPGRAVVFLAWDSPITRRR